MTPARQPNPQPNPDMNYSALERLDIKFSELIGAIEEKQVDGQLSSKDHGDYELACYCRGFIKAELEKERCASHNGRTVPEVSAVDRFNRAMISGQTISKEVDVGISFSAQELTKRDAAIRKAERERVLNELSDFEQKFLLCLNTQCCKKMLREKLESLRGGEQE